MLTFVFAAAIALSPAHFECDRNGQIVPPRNRLIAITPDEFNRNYASLPRTRFGAFAAPYDIERLDVFSSLEIVRDPDNKHAPAGGDLHLAVAIRRPPLDIRFGTPDASLPIIRVAVINEQGCAWGWPNGIHLLSRLRFLATARRRRN